MLPLEAKDARLEFTPLPPPPPPLPAERALLVDPKVSVFFLRQRLFCCDGTVWRVDKERRKGEDRAAAKTFGHAVLPLSPREHLFPHTPRISQWRRPGATGWQSRDRQQ